MLSSARWLLMSLSLRLSNHIRSGNNWCKAQCVYIHTHLEVGSIFSPTMTMAC